MPDSPLRRLMSTRSAVFVSDDHRAELEALEAVADAARRLAWRLDAPGYVRAALDQLDKARNSEQWRER